MPRICTNARVPIPMFRSSKAMPATGRRPRAIFDASGGVNPREEAEARRAISLRRQEGLHWDAYAHCDRAPFGWENGRG